jgi:hypothetical protein
MRRRLTITIAEDVYQALHERIGRGHIGGFIEDVVRPHVLIEDEADEDLEADYREMAADRAREEEALEWLEGLPGDSSAPPQATGAER